jgi:AcrR family transcriptional regulator
MGIAERRERDRQEMRQLILDAAMGLFVNEGFDQISMRRIAEKIEFSPATVYLYFKDKDDIMFELHRRAFDHFYSYEVRVASVADPFERLKKLGEVYMSFALENPEEYDLLFIMRGTGLRIKAEKDWDEGIRTYDFLKGVVKECLDQGLIKPMDPDVISLSMWGTVHGLVSLVIRNRLAMMPESQIRQLIHGSMSYLIDGIRL